MNKKWHLVECRTSRSKCKGCDDSTKFHERKRFLAQNRCCWTLCYAWSWCTTFSL